MAIVVGPDATQAGGDGPGDLLAALVDVGEQPAALVADAAADHDHPGGEVLGLEDPGDAGRGDDDLGPAGVVGPVRDAGVHDGHRRVRGGALLGQQQGKRPSEGGAAARGCTPRVPATGTS